MAETRITFESAAAWEHHLAEHERQVRERVARERRMLDRFPEIVEQYGAELCTIDDRSVVLIGEALVNAARLARGGA